MPPLIRDWIRRKLPASRLANLQARYHQTVIDLYQSKLLGEWRICSNHKIYWTHNAHHLEAVICALVATSTLTPDAYEEFPAYCCVEITESFLPHRTRDVYELLTRLRKSANPSTAFYFYLEMYSGYAAFLLNEHKAADAHYSWCIENSTTELTGKHAVWNSIVSYLTNLHHSGKALETVALIEKWLPFLRDCDLPVNRHDLLMLYTESLIALGRFQDAYDAICEAGTLEAFVCPLSTPAARFYKQGMALMGLGRDDKAMVAFDEALELFTQMLNVHGQADCLQQLGKLNARCGQINNGKRMIEDALKIYAAIPQMQSRAACLRSLGDVLKLKGDLEGAKAAYCEGLTFWEKEVEQGRGGEGWVQRFRERLIEEKSLV